MDERRIDGIQWLRAIMSWFVVIWHLGGGGRSAIFSPDAYRSHSYDVSDFVNLQILLLAVPCFMLISTYLLAMSGGTVATTLKRSERVALLLLFWPLAWIIYQGGWRNLFTDLPADAAGIPAYVLTAGYTIYYFFVSLLIVLALTCLAAQLPLWANFVLLATSVAIVGAAPLVSIRYDLPLLSAYWSPVNFIPYAFAAVVVLRALDRSADWRQSLAGAAVLFAAYCAFSYLEWRYYPDAVFFPGQSFAMPAYTRPSLVAGAMLLLTIAIHARPGLPPLVDLVAQYSLALYCLHLFVAGPVQLALSPIDIDGFTKVWAVIVLTIGLSYALSALLTATVLRRSVLF